MTTEGTEGTEQEFAAFCATSAVDTLLGEGG